MRTPDWANRALAVAVDRVSAGRVSILSILGAPNYERYCEHARRAHPEDRLLTRDEFYRRQLESRYSRPGTRCC